MPPGDTPSRLAKFKTLRADMDAELKQAISIEQAVERGLVEVGKCYAIRIWGNVIAAIKACKGMKERGGVLVRRREGKDVQVWALPEPKSEPEPVIPDDSGSNQTP